MDIQTRFVSDRLSIYKIAQVAENLCFDYSTDALFALQGFVADSETNFTQGASRILRVFTVVHAKEVRLTLALLASVFLLLTSFYIAKPVREAWLAVSVIGDLSNIEVRALSGLLQSFVLLALVPGYARLVDRLPRRKLVLRVNLGFAALFPVFWLLQPGKIFEMIPFVGVAFYVFIGMFAVVVVAQFWTFAADLFAEDAGKRLFPLIALGAAGGAVIGSGIADWLLARLGIHAYDLLWLALPFLLIGTGLIAAIDRKETRRAGSGKISPNRTGDPRSALKIVLSSRYILLVGLFIFMLNWVVTNGENILFGAIQESLQKKDPALDSASLASATGIAYSRLYLWVNLAGLLIQAFVVSRLIRFGGINTAVMVPPLVSLMSYGAMTAGSGLGLLTAAKTAENATNFSVANTARHLLWLPVAKEALYKAKTAIDTVGVRSADALAALTIILGTRLFDLSIKGFFAFNILLTLIWVAVAVLLVRERKRVGVGRHSGGLSTAPARDMSSDAPPL